MRGRCVAPPALLAALLAGCPTPRTTIPPPSASLTTAPCTLARCTPDDLVVTVRGGASEGALVTAIDITRALADGESLQGTTTATTRDDVDAGHADSPGAYEIVLVPRIDADSGTVAAVHHGDRLRVWQLIDNGVEIRRSNASDRELLVP